jgi:hypothetical protein
MAFHVIPAKSDLFRARAKLSRQRRAGREGGGMTVSYSPVPLLDLKAQFATIKD